MKEPREPVLNHWYAALSSPYGIELVTSDPDGLKTRLYIARKSAGDLDLQKISIVTSPFDPAKLWLIKRKPLDETA